MTSPVRLFTRAEIAGLLTPADCLAAVESAFAAGKRGHAHSPPPMQIPGVGGGFHAKGAMLSAGRPYAALKLNANFPGNPARGAPTIQGFIALCDAESGALLALMDSIEITLRRTAAASALAARHLAQADAKVLCICGCGAQARAQVEALAALFDFERGFAWDADPEKAAAFASGVVRDLALPFESASNLRFATRAAQVIVTCTTARTPFLSVDDIAPGAFVAALGADHSDKSELTPALMASAKVVVDVLDQCLVMGDLHHAVNAGAMTETDVYADLGDIVTGAKAGRTDRADIFVFDSTGTGIQDAACAAMAYERAGERGCGAPFRFSL